MSESSVKPGWKTTEFWMSLALVIIAFLASTDLGSEEDYPMLAKAFALVMAVITSLGYTVSRSIVKSGIGRK